MTSCCFVPQRVKSNSHHLHGVIAKNDYNSTHCKEMYFCGLPNKDNETHRLKYCPLCTELKMLPQEGDNIFPQNYQCCIKNVSNLA